MARPGWGDFSVTEAKGTGVGFDLGVKDQAVNCHPRPGVFPPVSMCVMMIYVCVCGVLWRRGTSALLPDSWGRAQGKPPRTLVFSASHLWPWSLYQEHRQVVLTLATNKKHLFPLQMALPRSYLQGGPRRPRRESGGPAVRLGWSRTFEDI